MKYKGIELKEFTSDRPLVFEIPKRMLVWDNEPEPGAEPCVHKVCTVYAYVPQCRFPVKCMDEEWKHGVEIPKILEPRCATNREVAKWLGQGLGQCRSIVSDSVWTEYVYTLGEDMLTCSSNTRIRKWDDTEWHKPTVDYMGLE